MHSVVNVPFELTLMLSFKKKLKYNKCVKGPKVKRKKIKDQRKFRLLGDQAIEGKKTKHFTYK